MGGLWAAACFGLRRVPMAAGGLLFLCSLLSPFYCYVARSAPVTIHCICRIYMWSYGSICEATCKGFDLQLMQFHFERWFVTFWSRSPIADAFGFPCVFVSLFFVQLATLGMASASVVLAKRAYTAAPTLLCLLTIFLMMLSTAPLWSTNRTERPPLQQGFWLAILSEPFFAVGFLARRGRRSARASVDAPYSFAKAQNMRMYSVVEKKEVGLVA